MSFLPPRKEQEEALNKTMFNQHTPTQHSPSGETNRTHCPTPHSQTRALFEETVPGQVMLLEEQGQKTGSMLPIRGATWIIWHPSSQHVGTRSISCRYFYQNEVTPVIRTWVMVGKGCDSQGVFVCACIHPVPIETEKETPNEFTHYCSAKHN